MEDLLCKIFYCRQENFYEGDIFAIFKSFKLLPHYCIESNSQEKWAILPTYPDKFFLLGKSIKRRISYTPSELYTGCYKVIYADTLYYVDHLDDQYLRKRGTYRETPTRYFSDPGIKSNVMEAIRVFSASVVFFEKKASEIVGQIDGNTNYIEITRKAGKLRSKISEYIDCIDMYVGENKDNPELSTLRERLWESWCEICDSYKVSAIAYINAHKGVKIARHILTFRTHETYYLTVLGYDEKEKATKFLDERNKIVTDPSTPRKIADEIKSVLS